ncbi:unnamed protein product [Moneuplotes crassus]|uniref:Uncharacterized protein n=1 Tax=Euplotes crassus TaxID=5936 RepID=A0AAD1USP4_EUPCR|nr:unnamed protein product [Moneuplotes crassus]
MTNRLQSTLSLPESQISNRNKNLCRKRYRVSGSMVSKRTSQGSSFSRNHEINQNLSILGTGCLKPGCFSPKKIKGRHIRRKQLKVNFKANLNLDLDDDIHDLDEEETPNPKKIIDIKVEDSIVKSMEDPVQNIPIFRARILKKKPCRINKSIYTRKQLMKPSFILFSPMSGLDSMQVHQIRKKRKFEPFKNLKFMTVRKSFDDTLRMRRIVSKLHD